MILRRRVPRRAAHLVECAIIYSVTMLLLAGLVIFAIGVFHYQQTAYLAREAARYAAVHAGQYQKENAAAITATTLPNVTKDYIIQNIVNANAFDMDTSALSVTITINTSSGSYDWDNTTDTNSRWPSSSATVSGTNYNETNTVSVTVTYTWTPPLFVAGPVTISSTSVMPMCY